MPRGRQGEPLDVVHRDHNAFSPQELQHLVFSAGPGAQSDASGACAPAREPPREAVDSGGGGSARNDPLRGVWLICVAGKIEHVASAHLVDIGVGMGASVLIERRWLGRPQHLGELPVDEGGIDLSPVLDVL